MNKNYPLLSVNLPIQTMQVVVVVVVVVYIFRYFYLFLHKSIKNIKEREEAEPQGEAVAKGTCRGGGAKRTNKKCH